MARVLDGTYQQSNRLADWGYPYPLDDRGRSQRNSLQGPEYMRLMRKRTKAVKGCRAIRNRHKRAVCERAARRRHDPKSKKAGRATTTRKGGK